MKCIWFIYLKKHKYAFQDDQQDVAATPTSSYATPTTSSLAPSSLASHATPKCSTNQSSLSLKKKSNAPSAKKWRKTSTIEIAEDPLGEESVMFDKFPEDENLFDNSLDCSLGDSANGDGGDEGNKAQGVTGNDLYVLLRKTKKIRTVQYFSIRYTIGMVYLGLLFSNQKVLTSELSRYDPIR